MSKIFYACFKNQEISLEVKEKIKNICKELEADNISSPPPIFYNSKNVIFGISNPHSHLEVKKENILFGNLFSKEINWLPPQTPAPDGNFVIFRATESIIEVLTDCLGTRSMWYFFDQEKIIFSSSQRAIIDFIGDFEFDERVIPWVLSNGTLGPSYSWDKRIKRIPPDGKLLLNRNSWELSVTSTPVIFKKSPETNEAHRKNLTLALGETFSSLRLDMGKWVITLSGGYDSRAILLLLKQHIPSLGKKLKTVTWGEKKSLLDKKSDAFVANILSRKEGTDHSYFSTEGCKESLEKVIQRFLENGEGRIDHISGYMDGFNIWKTLYEKNFEGVIRGDEVFGYNTINNPKIVNSFMGLTLLSDYTNLLKYPYLSSLQQEVPEILRQQENESISTWRDRVFQMYRIPVIQSALAELKDPYLKQINPFLSRKIVMLMRKMPDHLRNDKKLFRQIMGPLDNRISYSERDSNTPLRQLVRRQDFKAIIGKELLSDHASRIFPKEFLTQIQNSLESEVNEENHQMKRRLIGIVPKRIKTFLAGRRKSFDLDENVLAFRIFIICRMYSILSGESKKETLEVLRTEKSSQN